MSEPIQNRYEFVLLFDVVDGNPNGDPDAGNLPRIDPETGHGLVTDVCLKRKVRNYVDLTREGKPPHEIYVREKAILNQQHERAYEALKVDLGQDEDSGGKKKRKGGDKVEEARRWMCGNFYDIRTFGAVMSTGVNCGQVRGPVQLTFARSVDQIVTLEHSITRMAVTTEAESERMSGDNRTMGRKFTVSYGLYRAHGFVSAPLADLANRGTGFSQADLDLLWEALINMFDHDRSAARGQMATRKLIVFEHSSKFGSAPAHRLFDLVKVERQPGLEGPVRGWGDYRASIDRDALPQGVTLREMV